MLSIWHVKILKDLTIIGLIPFLRWTLSGTTNISYSFIITILSFTEIETKEIEKGLGSEKDANRVYLGVSDKITCRCQNQTL